MTDDIALAIGLDSSSAVAGAASFVKQAGLVKTAAAEMIASLAGVEAQMAKVFSTTAANTNTAGLAALTNAANALNEATAKAAAGLGTVQQLAPAHAAAATAAVSHAAGMAAVGKAYESSGVHAGSLVRELRAVFDELSSGRSRQAIGSLTLLFTRGLGVGIGPFAGIAAALAVPVAAVASWETFQRSILGVENEMRKTGDGSGATKSQLEANAQAVSASSDLSVKAVRAAQAALLDSGKISGDVIMRATSVIADYAKTTGYDAAKASDDLAKALIDPVQGAEDLDKQFDFLSTSQKRAIEDAKLSGDASKAQGLLLDALGLKMHQLGEGAVAPLEGFFTRAGHAVSNFFDNIGKSESLPTLTERIAKLKDEINRAPGAANSAQGVPGAYIPQASAPSETKLFQRYPNASPFDTSAERTAGAQGSAEDRLRMLEMASAQESDEANERASLKALSDRGKAFDELAAKADPLTEALRKLNGQMNGLDTDENLGIGSPEQRGQLRLQTYYQQYNLQSPAQRQQRQLADAQSVGGVSRSARGRVAASKGADQEYEQLAAAGPVGESQEAYRANAAKIAAQPQMDAANDTDARYLLEIAGQKKVFDAAQQGITQEKAAQAELQAMIAHDDNDNVDIETRKALILKSEFDQQKLAIQDRITATNQATAAATAEANATMQGAVALSQAKADAQAEAATRQAMATAQSQEQRDFIAGQQKQLANALLLGQAANENGRAASDIQAKRDELTIAETEQELLSATPELREQVLAKLREQLSIERDLALADPDKKQELLDLADQTAQVTAKTQQMQKEHQAATKTIDEVGSIGARALDRLQSGTGTWKDRWHSAFESAGEDVAKLIEKLLLIQPIEAQIAAALGTSSSGSSSLGGALLQGLGSYLFGSGSSTDFSGADTATSLSANLPAAGSGANLGAAGEIPGFASGGDPSVGSPSMVGEKGPELFVPKTAGTIIPADKTAGLLGGGGQQAAGHTFNIDARGADAGVEARINRAINAAIPSIVKASSGHAQAQIFSTINRGGNAAKIVGRR